MTAPNLVSLNQAALAALGGSSADDVTLALDVDANAISAFTLKDDVRSLCGAALPTVAVNASFGFDLTNPGAWDDDATRFAADIELAHELAADVLVVLTGPSGSLTWTEACARFQDAMSRVNPGKVRLALEPAMPLRHDLCFVHTFADAVDLARTLGMGVCLDTSHAAWERDIEQRISDAARAGDLAMVQLSDMSLAERRASRRLPAGDGDSPTPRLLDSALEAGYVGPLDLEPVGFEASAAEWRASLKKSVAWVRGHL